MTDRQVLLVKHSWSYVSSNLEDVSPLFVKKAAQLHPKFKTNLKNVSPDAWLKIMHTINHLVISLPDFEKAEKELLMLLAEYSDRGITKDFYDSLLIAFLMTLEKKIGKSWSEEIRDAWVFTFASIHMHLIRQLQPPAFIQMKTLK